MCGLSSALVLSIGPANALLLAGSVHGMMHDALCMRCRDGHDAAETRHPPKASDISILKSLLAIPPKNLQDFSTRLSQFNETLADLAFFAQPIPPYGQFTTFLQSISNHPAVASRVTMYFPTNPDIATHTTFSTPPRGPSSLLFSINRHIRPKSALLHTHSGYIRA
jgi:hypothetical protein